MINTVGNGLRSGFWVFGMRWGERGLIPGVWKLVYFEPTRLDQVPFKNLADRCGRNVFLGAVVLAVSFRG